MGGWSTLYEWLLRAKQEGNTPLLLELLKVYAQMPITVDLLKQNSCAKTIKQLTKGDNDSECSTSSTCVRPTPVVVMVVLIYHIVFIVYVHPNK